MNEARTAISLKEKYEALAWEVVQAGVECQSCLREMDERWRRCRWNDAHPFHI
jgi:hypothetical protein